MKNKAQYITNVFLYLAGVVILTHAVVPHHHHFELLESDFGSENCENINSVAHQEHRNLLLDCHALNLLASEKTYKNALKKVTSLFKGTISFGFIEKLDDVFLNRIVSTIFELRPLLLKPVFLTLFPLRAPPASIS